IASWRASTVASATNASTSTCSAACTPPDRSSRLGGSITTITGRIRAFAVSPRTSLQPGPPRPIRSTESNYERGYDGGNVKFNRRGVRTGRSSHAAGLDGQKKNPAGADEARYTLTTHAVAKGCQS